MANLTQSQPTINFEAAAVTWAQERADADAGRELLRTLTAKWKAEGIAAFEAQQPIASLWNDVQAAAYRGAALRTIASIFAASASQETPIHAAA